jgi:Putative adhesin
MMSTGTDAPTRPPQAPRSWGWQLIAAALTVLAVIAAGVTAWLWLRPTAHLTALTRSGVQTARYRRVTRAVPARLVLRVDSGGLSIRSGPAGRVTEQRQLTWSTRRPVVTESLAGGTLTITSRCPAGQRTCGAQLELTVPSGVAVQAELAAGNVAVSGLRGQVSVTASSGAIRLTSLAGPVRANSDSGDIVGEALTSGQVQARDDAGDISLAFAAVPGAVSATSDAGEVSIEVPRRPGGYRVRASTTAGDRSVSVQQDPRSAHAITVASDAGDVAVAYSQS